MSLTVIKAEKSVIYVLFAFFYKPCVAHFFLIILQYCSFFFTSVFNVFKKIILQFKLNNTLARERHGPFALKNEIIHPG